jgi:hypothetical protein
VASLRIRLEDCEFQRVSSVSHQPISLAIIHKPTHKRVSCLVQPTESLHKAQRKLLMELNMQVFPND